MTLKTLLKAYYGRFNLMADDIDDFINTDIDMIERHCPELLNRKVDHMAIHVNGCLTIVLKNA